MKYEFRNPDGITLIANSDADKKWLSFLIENRARATFIVGNWQSDIDPMAKKFEATELPGPGLPVRTLNFVPQIDGKEKE